MASARLLGGLGAALLALAAAAPSPPDCLPHPLEGVDADAGGTRWLCDPAQGACGFPHQPPAPERPPARLELAGQVPGQARHVIDAGGHWLAATRHSLLVYEKREPAAPRLVGQAPVTGELAWLRPYVYVLADDGTLHVVDLSRPTRPRVAASPLADPAYAARSYSGRLNLESKRLYLSGVGEPPRSPFTYALDVFDLEEPLAPRLLGRSVLQEPPRRLVFHGDVAYGLGLDELLAFDVSDPAHVSTIARVPADTPHGWVAALAREGDRLVVRDSHDDSAEPSNGTFVFDVSSPRTPRLLSHGPALSAPNRQCGEHVVLRDGLAFLVGQERFPLGALDLRDPLAPGVVGTWGLPESFRCVGGTALAADARTVVLGNARHGLLGFSVAAAASGDALAPHWRAPLSVSTDTIVGGDGWFALVGGSPTLDVFDVGGLGAADASPANPVAVGQWWQPEETWRAFAHAGWRAPYLVTVAAVDRPAAGEWLVVFDLSDPRTPRLRGRCTLDDELWGADTFGGYGAVAVGARTALVCGGDAAFAVDLRDPAAPTGAPLGDACTEAIASEILPDVYYARFLDLATREWRLAVVDLTDLAAPAVTPFPEPGGSLWGLAGDRLFVMGEGRGLRLYDVADPRTPVLHRELTRHEWADGRYVNRVLPEGRRLYGFGADVLLVDPEAPAGAMVVDAAPWPVEDDCSLGTAAWVGEHIAIRCTERVLLFRPAPQ